MLDVAAGGGGKALVVGGGEPLLAHDDPRIAEPQAVEVAADGAVSVLLRDGTRVGQGRVAIGLLALLRGQPRVTVARLSGGRVLSEWSVPLRLRTPL